MIDTSVRRSVMESIGNLSGKRRQFAEEFKADAVALVLEEGRSMADVARSLDMTYQTLGNWVRQAKTDRGERAGLTSEEKKELAALRKKCRQLEMERDLLKRAAAFFAKESQS